jgi:TorA maturation chaperone TorD
MASALESNQRAQGSNWQPWTELNVSVVSMNFIRVRADLLPHYLVLATNTEDQFGLLLLLATRLVEITQSIALTMTAAATETAVSCPWIFS